jgi:hypothetical protein
MQKDVAVGMAAETFRVIDIDAADSKRDASFELV